MLMMNVLHFVVIVLLWRRKIVIIIYKIYLHALSFLIGTADVVKMLELMCVF